MKLGRSKRVKRVVAWIVILFFSIGLIPMRSFAVEPVNLDSNTQVHYFDLHTREWINWSHSDFDVEKDSNLLMCEWGTWFIIFISEKVEGSTFVDGVDSTLKEDTFYISGDVIVRFVGGGPENPLDRGPLMIHFIDGGRAQWYGYVNNTSFEPLMTLSGEGTFEMISGQINGREGGAIQAIGMDTEIVINGGRLTGERNHTNVITLEGLNNHLAIYGGELKMYGNGTSILVLGTENWVSVNGGSVKGTNANTITIIGHDNRVVQRGGLISTETGTGVILQSGTVAYFQLGGLLYSPISGEDFLIHPGDGIVVQREGFREEQLIGTSRDLIITGNGGRAFWNVVDEQPGISFVRGTNSGFIPVYDVDITTCLEITVNELAFDLSDRVYNGDFHYINVALAPGIVVIGRIEFHVYYQRIGEDGIVEGGLYDTWRLPPIHAGNYLVTVRMTATGYDDGPFVREHLFELGTLTIEPARLVVIPNTGQWKYFGQADPEEFDFDVMIPVEGQIPDFAGSLTREPGEEVGEYFIIGGDGFKLIDNPPGMFLASNYALDILDDMVTFEIIQYNTEARAIANIPESGWFNRIHHQLILTAPENYEISLDGNFNVGSWAPYLEIPMVDGTKEEVTYFLRSTLDGESYHAITLPNSVTYNRDTELPVGVITIEENPFNIFIDEVTFELTFRNSIRATVSGCGGISGLRSIEWYITEDEQFIASAINWNDIDWNRLPWQVLGEEERINLDNYFAGVVIARITDNAGNVTILRSDGLIIFFDSQERARVTFYKDDYQDVEVDLEKNRNVVREIALRSSNGETIQTDEDEIILKENIDFVTYDNGILLKNDFLQTLPLGYANLAVSWNPLGIEVEAIPSRQMPRDTIIEVLVAEENGVELPPEPPPEPPLEPPPEPPPQPPPEPPPQPPPEPPPQPPPEPPLEQPPQLPPEPPLEQPPQPPPDPPSNQPGSGVTLNPPTIVEGPRPPAVVEEEEQPEVEGPEEEMVDDGEDLQAGLIPEAPPQFIPPSFDPNIIEEGDIVIPGAGRNVGIIVRNVFVGTLALGGFAALSQKFLMIKTIEGGSIDSW